MRLVGRAGVDGDVAGGRIAHQVAVGARAGHGAGVGRGEPLEVAQQRHGPLGLPVERMHDLPVGADQGQLAVGGLVLHVARLAAREQAGARTTRPQRLLVGHGGEHRVGAGEFRQALQRADGREDHEEPAGRMPVQRVPRAHPDGLELLGLVGHGLLALRHARDQEGHVEAPGQVAVGRPVREQEDRVGGQPEAARGALRNEGRAAVERGDVPGVGEAAVRMPCEQHAQFLEALADGRDGLGDALARLRGAVVDMGMRGGLGVLRVDGAAGKHVGPRREAGLRRAPRHEHFESAAGRVAQQQHGGRRARGGGLAVGMELLGEAGHRGIIGSGRRPRERAARKPPRRKGTAAFRPPVAVPSAGGPRRPCSCAPSRPASTGRARRRCA